MAWLGLARGLAFLGLIADSSLSFAFTAWVQAPESAWQSLYHERVGLVYVSVSVVRWYFLVSIFSTIEILWTKTKSFEEFENQIGQS